MRRRRTKRGKVKPRGAREVQAVINRQRGVKLAVAPLEEFLQRVRDGLGLAETELVICFVTDAEIARMNWAFRKKRGPTDVLSFPAEKLRARRSRLRRQAGGAGTNDARKGVATRQATKALAGKYLGDIAISPATARRYAKKNGRSFSSELRVLMLHGVLHLLGYDHESDRGEMDRLETKLRRRFGLA
jgi:probable rRNA maturation factor